MSALNHIFEMNGGAAQPEKSLPHVWVRFWSLKVDERFFAPGTDLICIKMTPLSFRPASGLTEMLILPWRRVRTTVLVRDVLPGGKSSPCPQVTEAARREVLKHSERYFSRDHQPERTGHSFTSGPSC